VPANASTNTKPKDEEVLKSALKAATEAKPSDSGAKSKKTTVRIVEGGDPLSGSKTTVSAGDDPLSMLSSASRESFVDPLDSRSSISSTPTISKKDSTDELLSQDDQLVAAVKGLWDDLKKRINVDFSVSGNIRLGANIVNEFAGSGVEDGSSSKQVDRYAKRLEQLERKIAKEDTVEFTQEECENHVKKLERDLDKAWANEERVKTLKLAIQISRMLSDTNVPQFYPYLFVLITNVLTRFGDMVYQRLLQRSEEVLTEQNPSGAPTKLPANFTSADVPSAAKDTTRNWFFKAACIRELLPRIYVEIALLRCFRFIADGEYPVILARIGSLIRGLGNPMISNYARAYLVYSGLAVAPQATNYITNVTYDMLSTFSSIRSQHVLNSLKQLNLTPAEYVRNISPSIEWLLKMCGRNATREAFQGMLQCYRDKCNEGTVLYYIIDSFDASFYIHASIGMIALIRTAEGISFDSTGDVMGPADLYRILGQKLISNPPPEEQKMQVLNDVWKAVSRVEAIGGYVRCGVVWMEVVMKHYSEREAMVMFAGVANKMTTVVELTEREAKLLEMLLRSLLTPTSALGGMLLTSEHLLKILDIFKGPRKVDLCKDVIEFFCTRGRTNDQLLINTMYEIGRTLHDSIEALSPEGERKQISAQLCKFIDRIDFGNDLELQLNTYVDCRAIFSNLDFVTERLIMCVASLAMKAYKLVKGKHTKKTGAFAKACLAFCHITVPSIMDSLVKLKLLLLCAQVALVNQCLPQTDTFLKAAISLIPDVPAFEEVDGKRYHTEEKVALLVRSLLGFLVVVPGHPEHGPFYIVQGLRNALPRYAWQENSTLKFKSFLDILALLCTYSCKSFPYHIQHVESNDALYVRSKAYLTELQENIIACMEEIIRLVTSMGERAESSSKANQVRMILDLVNQLMARMELNNDMNTFVMKLLELASKSKGSLTRQDLRYMALTVDFVRKRAEAVALQNADGALVGFIGALRSLQVQ
jgi:hypothetical protein